MKKNKLELQKLFLNGSKELKEYVEATFGPKGRTIAIQGKNPNSAPVITKDGVTVSNCFSSEDPFENIAINILRQAAQKTCDESGDGTTTTTILATKIYEELCKRNVNPALIKEEMENRINQIILFVQNKSTQVTTEEQIEQIALISSNGDKEISEVLKKAISTAGFMGSILFENSKTTQTYVNSLDGFRMDSGYLSDKFVNRTDNMSVNYERCRIIVTDYCFGANAHDALWLELVVRDKTPVIVVASEYDIDGPGVGVVLANYVKRNANVALIKAPRFGDEKRAILDDLCIATGATLISKSNGLLLKDVKLEHMGFCEKFESTKYNTIIAGVAGNVEKVQARIEGIKEQITQTEHPTEVEILNERISRLNSGTVIIQVGANTEAELLEKRHRYEDALGAVKATLSSGFVPGGSKIYCLVAEKLCKGIPALKEAYTEPLKVLCKNSEQDFDTIYSRIKKENEVIFNFRKNKFENFEEAGVIEPTDVVISSIKNSFSAAMLLYQTDGALIQ